MGHQRLGNLPALHRLPQIVQYLVTGGTPTEDLVNGVTDVGQQALERAIRDPVFIEALWLLIRLPQAAGVGGHALADYGVRIGPDAGVADIMAGYSSALERVQRQTNDDGTDLGEIARQAGTAALADAIQARLPGLWEPTFEDVRASLSRLKGTEQFAAVSHQFYANFVERVIHYYVDRNLDHLVGPERVASSVRDLRAFDTAIRRHCDESALIMRGFARDWLGKNHFRDGKETTRDDVRRFSAYAAQKMKAELEQRKGAQ